MTKYAFNLAAWSQTFETCVTRMHFYIITNNYLLFELCVIIYNPFSFVILKYLLGRYKKGDFWLWQIPQKI